MILSDSRVLILLSFLLLSLLEGGHAEHEDTVTSWILFKDKVITESNFQHVTDRVLERRRKTRPHLQVDARDAPVNQEYIHQVMEVVSSSGRLRTTSKWINGISVECSSSALDAISSLPFVSETIPVRKSSRPILSMEEDTFWMEEDDVWTDKRSAPEDYGRSAGSTSLHEVSFLHQLGFDGNGVTIVVLDSGFRLEHEVFQHLKIAAQWDFIQQDNITSNQPGDSEEQCNHGTYVLSALAGYKEGQLVGPAYNATFLLAKTEIVNEEVQEEEDYFVAGLEWGEENGADIVTASLGYFHWYTFSDCDGTTAITTKAVNTAIENGMFVTISVGNRRAQGISPPSDAFFVLSVGAVDDTGQVANFTSIGPTVDGRIKPEVAAAGVDIHVASPGSLLLLIPISTFAESFNSYRLVSGTSLSAPLVTGIAALLLQAHHDWTPIQLREALMRTASNSNNPNTVTGWGIVNATAAYLYTPASQYCPNNCSYPQGLCNETSGQCMCDSDYYDMDCAFQRLTCEDYCGVHGKCNSSNLCQCKSGYFGIDCSLKYVTRPDYILETVLSIAVGIVVLAGVAAVMCLAPASVQHIRILFFALLGTPLLDIALSGTLYGPTINAKSYTYEFTYMNGWIATEWLWKLWTALLVFPKVMSTKMVIIAGIAGSFLHVAWFIPVAYHVYIQETSSYIYTILQSIQLLGNTVLDFIILPFAFYYLKKKNLATVYPTPVPSSDNASQVTEDGLKADESVPITTYIHYVTYFCMGYFVVYQIVRFIITDSSFPLASLLMILFVPIGIVFFIDRKKIITRNFPYFIHYLFIVGALAVVPVEIVADLYILLDNYSFLSFPLMFVQSFVMQLITLLSKKAAKNMTTKVMAAPFVFRYQFFEDFLATLLFLRRSPQEPIFWIFVAYQVIHITWEYSHKLKAVWTVFRNTGYFELVATKLRRYFAQIIRTFTIEQSVKEFQSTRNLTLILLNSQQYLICDLVAIIAITAQYYTNAVWDLKYPQKAKVKGVIWQVYLILGLIKLLCHGIVYAILRLKVMWHNEKIQDSEKCSGYWILFLNHMKTYGPFFTMIALISTRDAYIAARALFKL